MARGKLQLEYVELLFKSVSVEGKWRVLVDYHLTITPSAGHSLGVNGQGKETEPGVEWDIFRWTQSGGVERYLSCLRYVVTVSNSVV